MQPRCCDWRSGVWHAAAGCPENCHVHPSQTRCPPPRPQATTPRLPLSRLWSSLPAAKRQEVLMVLSQVVAKSLPPAQRQEAGHEHP